MAEHRIRVRRWVDVPAFSERGTTPERLLGYALAHGWQVVDWYDERRNVQIRWGTGKAPLWKGCRWTDLPHFREYADFQLRMEEALIAISEAAGVHPDALRNELAVD